MGEDPQFRIWTFWLNISPHGPDIVRMGNLDFRLGLSRLLGHCFGYIIRGVWGKVLTNLIFRKSSSFSNVRDIHLSHLTDTREGGRSAV